MTEPERIPIAYVRRAHGIRGDIVVRALASDAADRLVVGRSLQTAAGSTYLVGSSKPHGPDHLVHLDGVDDRTAAEGLVGARFTIDTSERRALEDDEWWVDDVVGCRVVDPSGQAVGIVVGVAVGSAQDRLVIETAEGRTADIPLVDELVPIVDIEARRVVVDPLPGLLDP